MSGVIRPVSRRLPASQEILDDSNFPLSCVITPLDSDDDDTIENGGAGQKLSHPQLLSSIPKCLHCGAPHASRMTHFRPRAMIVSDEDDPGRFLICYLCGKMSSTRLEHQQEKRAAVEGDLTALLSTREYKEQNSNKNREQCCVFQLPLRLENSSSTQRVIQQPVYKVPAVSCPPLWFVLLDGSCHNPLYWQTVSRILQEAIKDIPAHVHVAILIASSTVLVEHNYRENQTTSESEVEAAMAMLAVFQLTSPVPHLIHHYYQENTNNETSTSPADLVAALCSSLADGVHHRAHLQTACRSLMDYLPPIVTPETTAAREEQGDTVKDTGLPLAWVTELIVESLQLYGHPAGQHQQMYGTQRNRNAAVHSTSDVYSKQRRRRPYAGGKLTCFLADRPSGICPRRRKQSRSFASHTYGVNNRYDSVGRGGMGGRTLYQPGKRFGSFVAQDVDDGSDEANLARSNGSLKSKAFRHETINNNTILLEDVEAGGTLVDQYSRTSLSESDLTSSRLQEHYQPESDIAMYFNDLGRQCAQVSLGVDILVLLESCGNNSTDSMLDNFADVPDVALPLFGILSHKSGAPGPLLFDMSSVESMELLEREVSSRVPWRSNLVFGAELRLRLPPGFIVDDEPVDHTTVENGRTVHLAPLYADKGLYGSASSVEDSNALWRMGCCNRNTSFTIDLALKRNVVPSKLNLEGFGEIALKPVIQTCFAYTIIVKEDESDNFVTVRQMRINSCPVPLADNTESIYDAMDPEALAVVIFHKLALAFFQQGVLESAKIAEEWLLSTLICAYNSAEKQAHMLEHRRNEGQEKNGTTFYINERLFTGKGSLSKSEVALAQGHNKLCHIPLLTYLLLQCDAFRPSRPDHAISFDLRYAALAQIMSMTPGCLTRCIAPRLQLWASGEEEKEPIVDVLDLNGTAVRSAIDEFDTDTTTDLIFFLDAPDQICVFNSRYVNTAKITTFSASLVVGEGLKQTINEAVDSYRTPPSVLYELDYCVTKSGIILAILSDILAEDAPSSWGHENYAEWKLEIAEQVSGNVTETGNTRV